MSDSIEPAPAVVSDAPTAGGSTWLRGAVVGAMVGAILGLLREADSSVGPLPSGLGMAVLATFGAAIAGLVGIVALFGSNRRAGVGILAAAVAGFAVFKVLELVFNAI